MDLDDSVISLSTSSLQSSNESKSDCALFETSEGRIFNVPINVIKKFYTLKTMLEDSEIGENRPVKLTQISGRAFEKMIEFASAHLYDPPLTEEQASKERRRTSQIKGQDEQFVSSLSKSMIFELIVASNYLDFQQLLELLSKAVANMIKNKSVEEIRSTFNIKNDFTPQEEKKLAQENSWIEKLD